MQNFLENITFRRHRNYSDSDINESNIIDGTLDGTRNSLPNISDDEDDDKVKELMETIKKLTSELNSAHEEITSLNLENNSLRLTNKELMKKNELYKKVTNSPLKQQKTQDSKNSKRTNKDISTQTPKHENKRSTNDEQTQTNLTNSDSNNAEKSPISKKRAKGKKSKKGKSETHTETENLDIAVEQPKQNKTKICILSGNTTNKVLHLAENTMENCAIFHHLTHGASTAQLLDNVETNVKDFTLNDYCIIMIGEDDFETTKNYVEIIYLIREKLQKIMHTNVILCAPTFKCGPYSDVYNWRIETFNSLLYLDLEEHKHAYALDSNKNLAYDKSMFYTISGKINDHGMKTVFRDILKMTQDIKNGYDSNTSTDDHSECDIAPNPSDGKPGTFFRG